VSRLDPEAVEVRGGGAIKHDVYYVHVLSLSVPLSLCVSICVCLYVSVCLSVSLSLSPSLLLLCLSLSPPQLKHVNINISTPPYKYIILSSTHLSIETGVLLKQFHGNTALVQAVFVQKCPDGEAILLNTSASGNIRVWDLETGEWSDCE
jgi:WD40 repeat protein